MMRYGRYPDSPLLPSLPYHPFARDRDPKKSKPKLVKTRVYIQRTLANNARDKSSCSRGEGSAAAGRPFARHPPPCPALIILLLHGGGSVMGCADYAAALTYCNYRLNCWEAKKHLVYLTRKDRYWG